MFGVMATHPGHAPATIWRTKTTIIIDMNTNWPLTALRVKSALKFHLFGLLRPWPSTLNTSRHTGGVASHLPVPTLQCSARFPLPELTARVHGPSRAVNSASGNARPSTRPYWRVMEIGHPSTRAINLGSGNRALACWVVFPATVKRSWMLVPCFVVQLQVPSFSLISVME